MPLGEHPYPFSSFRFQVELGGILVGGFTEVSALQMEMEVEEYREGGLNEYMYKLPKFNKYSNITLKHGKSASTFLWDWYRKGLNGVPERKNGSIILLDYAGKVGCRWDFIMAFPVKWIGPELRADNSMIAIESLELAHQGLLKA